MIVRIWLVLKLALQEFGFDVWCFFSINLEHRSSGLLHFEAGALTKHLIDRGPVSELIMRFSSEIHILNGAYTSVRLYFNSFDGRRIIINSFILLG